MVGVEKRLYPRSCFWKTFHDKQEESGKATSNSDVSRQEDSQLLLSTLFTEVTFKCGEVDGVVLGPWVNLSSNSTDYSVIEESALTGYWAAAAVWSSNWDQKTIDRVCLYLCLSWFCISLAVKFGCCKRPDGRENMNKCYTCLCLI